jgi:chondroitin 4-sulfotransferase 11
MPISTKLRSIFIHIPKNAGTSVLHALGMVEYEGHIPWWEYRQMDPRKWDSYFKFAIVRNPWERTVSNYLYARMRRSYWHSSDTQVHPDFQTLEGLTFAQCIPLIPKLRHPGWRSQSYWICNSAGKNMMDYVCRHEQLEEDMAHVWRVLGVQRSLPQINVTEKKSTDWRSFYDKSTEEAVQRLYAVDVDHFGYAFS